MIINLCSKKMDPITLTALISGASALASGGISLFGNRKAQQNMENYRNYLNARKAETDTNIQRLENEDALQTKQGRALANEARETVAEQNTAAAGRDAVMGGSGINTAKAKAANTETLRKVYRDIITNHEATTGARLANLEGIKANYDNLIAQGKVQQANANIAASTAAAKGLIGAVQAGAMAYGAKSTGSDNAQAAGSNNGTQIGVVQSNTNNDKYPTVEP